jgi:hypothetical protein
VFARSAGVWSEQGKLIPSSGVVTEYVDFPVAIDGDTVLVPARNSDADCSNCGAVYVFTRTGGVWSQQAILTANDGASGDDFGNLVSIDGDTAVVGAGGDDDNGSNSGSVYVFVRSGGVWSQQAKLTPGDGAAGDQASWAVIDGDTIVAGADGDADHGFHTGSAYVYVRSGGVWSEQAKLTASDGAGGDNFGFPPALDGDTAVIGAWGDDDNGSNSGSAYVFTRSGGSWSQEAKLTASDAATNYDFGFGVGLDGNTVVVGAEGSLVNGIKTGAAYVYLLGSDVDDDGVRDTEDPCPADPLDQCDQSGSAAEEASVDEGGTVETPDGQLALEIDPGDLTEDTTISVTETVGNDPEVDLSIGPNAGLGQALAFYDLEPDGLQFDSAITLNVVVDVSLLNASQRTNLDVYRFEDTDMDGIADAFIPLGAVCNLTEDPLGTFIANCAVQIDHFSSFAIVVPQDSDGDGVPDDFNGVSDVCPAEDATGFDVDNNGCIDSFSGLADIVAGLVSEGVIATQMQTSLLAKVGNAESSASRDSICSAINELDALKQQVAAQLGKKISIEAATLVTAYADSVIAHHEDQLPVGDSCQ